MRNAVPSEGPTSQEPATRGDLRELELPIDAKIEIAVRDLKIGLGSIMAIAVGAILIAIRCLPVTYP